MSFNFISSFIDSKDPVIITPYGGYANELRILASGRVLEDEGIKHHEDDGALRNIWNSIKRFESDEKEGMHVCASWLDQQIDITSDEEGYFFINHLHGITDFPDKSTWLPVDLLLRDKGEIKYTTRTEILRPGKASDFGVISDLDDTVIETGVSSLFKWKLLINSIASHAHKRSPLEGAEELYRSLHLGPSGANSNPMFYVSNSPWNLHEYLSSFLLFNGFPKGVLLLRDIGNDTKRKTEMTESRKYLHIQSIIESYPWLQFVLIGDAAEVDTDIYLSLATLYPGRIKQILIRAVGHKKNMKRVAALIEQATDIEVSLVEDKNEAISICRASCLIE